MVREIKISDLGLDLDFFRDADDTTQRVYPDFIPYFEIPDLIERMRE